MGFLFLRVVSIFFTVFIFSLVVHVVWKKWVRPILLKEKLDGELLDAKEAFARKQTEEKAQDIAETGGVSNESK